MLKLFPSCHPIRDHRRCLRCRGNTVQPQPCGSTLCCFTSQSGEGVLQETGADQAGFGRPHAERGAGLSQPLQRASWTNRPQNKLLSVPGPPEGKDQERWYILSSGPLELFQIHIASSCLCSCLVRLTSVLFSLPRSCSILQTGWTGCRTQRTAGCP